ncbi:hypothetical protein LBW12_05395 [Latilactobacillus curvatus]|uniref:hypothetical protein n=1 Tax=Latilactobacillus curvatus TaxID=28038 RepID=UPI0020C82073|nr:hypothetical protein [Latilactobacillus curvatus]MCP8859458.1 hypothetical protein [Latilactobacillus curvatus]
MIDTRVQVLSEHLMAGQRITPEALMRHLRCSRKEAVDLLEQATNRMEEQLDAREIQKQNEVAAKRRAQRYFGRSSRYRSNSYR